jgi:hypothetical protein
MPDTNYPPNLEELLDEMNFPATKAEIVNYAESRDPSEEAMELLRILPKDEYETLRELNKDLGLSEDLPNNDDLWPDQRAEKLFDEKNRELTEITGQGKISGG